VKICAVVIWYNPGKDMWKNVESYLPFVDKCIIVDNSAKDNSNLIETKSEKINYIPNNGNLGIAKALNQGCNLAQELGFEWVLTMDQDSYFDKKEIEKYFKEVKKIHDSNNNVVSFSPNYNLKRNVGEEYVKSIITSGNVLKLSAWKKVGKFDDKLFINEVDTIFCYELLSKGYLVCQIYGARMAHNVFDKYFHIKLFGKNYNIRQDDSALAKYYITRNSFEKNKLFPKLTENKHFLIKSIIKVIFFEYNKFEKLKMIFRGYVDYKNRKFGKYGG
jgi:rhamnosyltransferase